MQRRKNSLSVVAGEAYKFLFKCFTNMVFSAHTQFTQRISANTGSQQLLLTQVRRSDGLPYLALYNSL